MKTQLLNFTLVIVLGLTVGACEKAIIPPPQIDWQDFIGNWENVNGFANSIDRITITSRVKGRISVQLWGKCDREVCELALFSYGESELTAPSLPMKVLWNDRELSLRLEMTASGKMELKAMDADSGIFETQFYSWMQTSSFFGQVEQVDARSLDLANDRINGSPRDPDNLLTSGNILVFQTNEGRLGKIQVRGNDFYLSIRWTLWSSDGTIFQSIDYFPVYKIGYYDLDHGKLDDSPDHRYSDFYWSIDDQVIRWLEPLNGAGFALYHQE